MSIPEIILLAFLALTTSGFIGYIVFDSWKRTQAYEGAMEAIQETCYSIADSMESIAFNMTLYNSRHEPPQEGFLK